MVWMCTGFTVFSTLRHFKLITFRCCCAVSWAGSANVTHCTKAYSLNRTQSPSPRSTSKPWERWDLQTVWHQTEIYSQLMSLKLHSAKHSVLDCYTVTALWTVIIGCKQLGPHVYKNHKCSKTGQSFHYSGLCLFRIKKQFVVRFR